jgi:hypothetical protein
MAVPPIPLKWMDGFRFSSVLALWFKSTSKFRRRGLDRSSQSSLKTDLSRPWPPGVSQLQEEGAGSPRGGLGGLTTHQGAVGSGKLREVALEKQRAVGNALLFDDLTIGPIGCDELSRLC